MRHKLRFLVAVLVVLLPLTASAERRRAVRPPSSLTLRALFPYRTTEGGAAFTLAVDGIGFLPTTVLRWNDSDRPTRVLDFAHLEASIAAADIAAVGTARVRVVHPASGAFSNELTFSVVDGITVNISPQTIDVPFDARQQFVALVTGTPNPAVTWSANTNSITADGVFTAPVLSDPSQATVRATSVANPAIHAEAAANIVAPIPTISGLSPAAANAGVELAILGTGYYGNATVVFPAGNGLFIPCRGIVDSSTRIRVTVPLGASSGPLHLELQSARFPVVVSQSVPFNRLPALFVRSARKDLSSGDSVRLDLRFLGDVQPRPVTWTAERGTVSADGVYRAPVVVDDQVDRVRVCVTGTSACGSVLIAVHPLRIEPAGPAVRADASLRLMAVQGDREVAPVWTVEDGRGTLASDGLFTPPSVPDGGGVPVKATFGTAVARASVAVTGTNPGLVARIRDYLDVADRPGLNGKTTQAVVASGRLAYVLSSAYPNDSRLRHFLIEIYDIGDPSAPVWLDALEPVCPLDTGFPPPAIFANEGALFVVPSEGTRFVPLAVYDVIGDRATLSGLGSLPLFANSIGPLGVGTFTGASLYGIGSYEQSASPTAFRATVSGVPGRRSIASTQVRLPLPAGVAAVFVEGMAGSGNRLYVTMQSPALTLILAAYDISSDPAVLLGTVAPKSCCAMKIRGQRMVVGMELFDLSGDVPVSLTTLPVSGGVTVSVDDLDSSRVLVRTSTTGLLSFDVANAEQPKAHAVLFDGQFTTNGGVFAGNFVLSASLANGSSSGFAVYDAAPLGGAFKSAELRGGGVFGGTYDQRVDAKRLFWAEASDLGSFVNIYDLSVEPPALLARVSEPTRTVLSLQPFGNVLYAGTDKALLVLNVTDPSAPVTVAELPFAVSALALSGSRLFVGTLNERLVVLDVSNPLAPTVTANVDLPGFPNHIQLAGNVAFIAAHTAGLLAYDVSKAAPALLSNFSVSSAVDDVAVDGTIALLASFEAGLVIVDVSDPTKPHAIGRAPLSRITQSDTYAISVGIHQQIAWVGAAEAGVVYGFDYQQPAHPRLVSLVGCGSQLDAEVDNFSFFGSDMFVGGGLNTSTLRRYDVRQPRNVLNLYPTETFEQGARLAISRTVAR